MFALIVHDSDEVKDCFVGTEEEIFEKVKQSTYWADIVSRMYELEDEEGYVITEDKITLKLFTNNLYHDGDSEDGYTLITAK